MTSNLKHSPAVDFIALDDDALMALIGDGDQQAGSEFTRRHLSYVLKVCAIKLSNQADIEEAAQDVFASVWRTGGNWKPGNAKVTTWLYRVATNRAIDILRHKKHTHPIEEAPEIVDEASTAEYMQQCAEQHSFITRALSHLKANQKRAIELVYYQELSQKEAAEIMGLSLDALESTLRRARANLHNSLARQRENLISL